MAFNRRLIRLRTTALLLTFWLIEMPMQVGRTVSTEMLVFSADKFNSTNGFGRRSARSVKFGVDRRKPAW